MAEWKRFLLRATKSAIMKDDSRYLAIFLTIASTEESIISLSKMLDMNNDGS